MKEKLEKRLQALKEEFENGQKLLSDLEGRRTEIQQNLLRISGAIQVLEEELNAGETVEEDKPEGEEEKKEFGS